MAQQRLTSAMIDALRLIHDGAPTGTLAPHTLGALQRRNLIQKVGRTWTLTPAGVAALPDDIVWIVQKSARRDGKTVWLDVFSPTGEKLTATDFDALLLRVRLLSATNTGQYRIIPEGDDPASWTVLDFGLRYTESADGARVLFSDFPPNADDEGDEANAPAYVIQRRLYTDGRYGDWTQFNDRLYADRETAHEAARAASREDGWQYRVVQEGYEQVAPFVYQKGEWVADALVLEQVAADAHGMGALLALWARADARLLLETCRAALRASNLPTHALDALLERGT